jgi:hypothetical protein
MHDLDDAIGAGPMLDGRHLNGQASVVAQGENLL